MSKKLKVHLVQGKGLQGKNKGTSSPYCEVRSLKQEKREKKRKPAPLTLLSAR